MHFTYPSLTCDSGIEKRFSIPKHTEVFMEWNQLIGVGVVAMMAMLPGGVAKAFAPRSPSMTFAYGQSALVAKGEIVLRPDTVPAARGLTEFKRLGSNVEIEVDSTSGAPRLITGELGLTPHNLSGDGDLGQYEAVAREWMASHQDLIKVESTDLVLSKSGSMVGSELVFVRFDVTRHGLPVSDAGIYFRFKSGVLRQVLNRGFGEALDDTKMGLLSGPAAIHALAPEADVVDSKELYRVVARAGHYQLTRVVESRVNVGDESLLVQTDAVTGDVFSSRDTKHFLDGVAHGKVFARTYYRETALDAPLPELRVTAGSTTLMTDRAGGFSADETVAPGISGIKGGRAFISLVTGNTIKRQASRGESGWDISVDVSAEKDLAQVNAFYHVNKIVQKAKKYINTSWLNRSLRINSNLSRTCNAYWQDSAINFFSSGNGCGNTGLSSDGVYHEWGHGLDANTGGINDGAFSEGYGDIMAMLITEDSKMAPGFHTSGSGIRDLASGKVYPRDRGEVHAEGLIIGGAFWDLFKALRAKYDAAKANDLVSKIAFNVIFTAPTYRDVFAAALIIDDDDANQQTRAPDFCEINGASAAHGLTRKASNCQ